MVARPCRRRRPSSLDDGGISGLFSSGGPSVRFLRSLEWGGCCWFICYKTDVTLETSGIKMMNYQFAVSVMVSYLHLTSSHVWERRRRDGSWDKVKVTQLCLTLCDLMDYSPPGSSAHGILQARMLEWVAIPFSRGSSQPRY